MIFTYRCPGASRSQPHLLEREFGIGTAPDAIYCAGHDHSAPRHFAAETMPQIGVDPFRAFDLSPKKEAAQAEQQRYVEAPRDRIEAKAIEATTGRIYVGDDKSGMTKAAQRGIEKAKDAQRKIIVPVSA
jgi:hypothetical protein